MQVLEAGKSIETKITALWLLKLKSDNKHEKIMPRSNEYGKCLCNEIYQSYLPLILSLHSQNYWAVFYSLCNKKLFDLENFKFILISGTLTPEWVSMLLYKQIKKIIAIYKHADKILYIDSFGLIYLCCCCCCFYSNKRINIQWVQYFVSSKVQKNTAGKTKNFIFSETNIQKRSLNQ